MKYRENLSSKIMYGKLVRKYKRKEIKKKTRWKDNRSITDTNNFVWNIAF